MLVFIKPGKGEEQGQEREKVDKWKIVMDQAKKWHLNLFLHFTFEYLVTSNCKGDQEKQLYLCAQEAGNQVFANTDEMECSQEQSMDFCTKLSQDRD